MRFPQLGIGVRAELARWRDRTSFTLRDREYKLSARSLSQDHQQVYGELARESLFGLLEAPNVAAPGIGQQSLPCALLTTAA
jgi:hypothetical protein